MKQIKSRKQIRLNGYDYSKNGYYFVTICSYNKRYVFGDCSPDNKSLVCEQLKCNAIIKYKDNFIEDKACLVL